MKDNHWFVGPAKTEFNKKYTLNVKITNSGLENTIQAYFVKKNVTERLLFSHFLPRLSSALTKISQTQFSWIWHAHASALTKISFFSDFLKILAPSYVFKESVEEKAEIFKKSEKTRFW